MITSPQVEIYWDIPIQEKVHRVLLKQDVLRSVKQIFLDNVEIHRDTDDFNVGETPFLIGTTQCSIVIERDPQTTNHFYYKLEIDRRSYFRHKQAFYNNFTVWNVFLNGHSTRIVMKNATMDVWVNGEAKVTEGVFIDEGTAHTFHTHNFQMRVVSDTGGIRKDTHKLLIGDQEQPTVHPTVNLDDCIFEADFTEVAKKI